MRIAFPSIDLHESRSRHRIGLVHQRRANGFQISERDLGEGSVDGPAYVGEIPQGYARYPQSRGITM